MNPPKMETATLKKVADVAGVHASTVSRALDPSKRHLVKAEVLARIDAIARKLHYRPNRAAAALRTGRTRTVAVLVPTITNPIIPLLLSGIEAGLATEGYVPFLVNSSSGIARNELIDRLMVHRPDGVIVVATTPDDAVVKHLSTLDLEVVLLSKPESRKTGGAVYTDDDLGIKMVIDHLVSLGHETIAHLAGPQTLSTAIDRVIAFKASCRAAGVKHGPIEECDAYTRDAGRRGCERLLVDRQKTVAKGRKPGFSAIFAANDLVALGAYDAILSAGLRIPDDLSIVGFNDIPFVDMLNPPLTTVNVHQREKGFRAAKMMLSRLESRFTERKTSSFTEVVLQPELVVRGSTGRQGARRT